MLKVELFGTNEEAEIDETKITVYEEYEEAYQLSDERWIAYDEAVCAWVMLG
jgi:hypothetical protein